ncbi:MAG: S-methyl-5-thioribose-1-phosphate isomerase, partial [Methanothrix sp.]
MHSTEPRTIWWDEGLWLIDQTQLPERYIPLKIESISQLVAAIKSLSVRGAPALGAAGAYSIALAAERSHASNAFDMIAELEVAADMIRSSRPTAINLSWGVERALREASEGESIDEIRERALRSAEEIAEEDIRINHAIGRNGAKLLEDGETILTHCNAGRLACVGWGTALGVVRSAAELGKRIQVFACETRPLHQGSRLTAWELKEDGIPVTLICESMSGSLMRKARIDKVIVGADRITRDAVFNKIGTYNHAVLAKHHKIPFYVAAPLSTFDRMNGEEEIIIEERDPEEICTLGGVRLA